MDLELEGRLALVVGGTSGIGLAAARQFVRAGARVVVAGRDEARGQAAQASLGRGALFLPCDVTAPGAVQGLLRSVQARFGRLDAAVNAAALGFRPAPLLDIALEEAEALLATDVRGPFLCLKHQIEALLAGGGGTIVNVASVNGLSGTAGASLYSAGRHAVLGLTRSAALEYIGRGVRINAVCPGAVDTPRRGRRLAGLSPEDRARAEAATAAAIPLGRLARADEIGEAIVWLSSPRSSYVVGHALVIDGGLSA